MVQWFLESLLVDCLGVTRNKLEDFRSQSLKKSVDWKKENRHVLLSEAAVKKILRDLGSPDLDYSGCAQKNGDEPPGPEILELTVTRVFPNPHLIEASLETGELVRVSVMNNKNFRPKMKVNPLSPRPDGPQLYRLQGRTPRFPGRW
jgi:hypothetical protein